MLKPQDIVALLKLAGHEREWTYEGIGEELGLSPSAVHRGLERAKRAGLYDDRRKAARGAQLHEFLVHGGKYVFPAEMRGEARGIPTAWAAPPLKDLLASSDRNVPVWPHPGGKTRGIALEPLHPIVPEAARRDPALAELLTLFDAVRIGGPRERSLAAKELRERLSRARISA
jgi:hypothetical protein